MTFLLINRIVFHNWCMSQLTRCIISKNVKALRENSKLKREELSLALGFDNSYISKLELERVNITIDRLEKIANYFNVDVYKLLQK